MTGPVDEQLGARATGAERYDDLASWVAVSKALREADTIDGIVATVLDLATAHLGARTAAVFLRDAATGDLVAHGWVPEQPDLVGRRLAAGKGVIGQVDESARAHSSPNPSPHPSPHLSPNPSPHSSPNLSPHLPTDPLADMPVDARAFMRLGPSVMTVSLQSRDAVVGVLRVGFAAPRELTEVRQHLVAAMADVAGIALQHVLAVADLEQRLAVRTRELVEARVRLMAIDRQREAYVASLGHELRAPLTNIRLYLDLLQRGRRERHAHYLTVLDRETDRMGSLIDDLIELSRLEICRAPGTFVAAPVDLADTVATALAALAPRAEAAGVALSVAKAAHAVSVPGDPDQLARLVFHLVSNSIAYTPRGGEVTVDLACDSDATRLVVEDTGLGIPATERARVFDRYYRGERVRGSGISGTGLGLAIVQEIVVLHGGTVEVADPGEVGTRIVVRLPASEVSRGE